MPRAVPLRRDRTACAPRGAHQVALGHLVEVSTELGEVCAPQPTLLRNFREKLIMCVCVCFKFYLFIYLWLCWVLVAAHGLFSSCGEPGLLFNAVRRLLIAVASLIVEHGL